MPASTRSPGDVTTLREVVPAGMRAAREAEKVRTRLLAEVNDSRNPRTNATVNQLLDRGLDVRGDMACVALCVLEGSTLLSWIS